MKFVLNRMAVEAVRRANEVTMTAQKGSMEQTKNTYESQASSLDSEASNLESQAAAQDIIANSAMKIEYYTDSDGDSHSRMVPDTAARASAAAAATALRAQAGAKRSQASALRGAAGSLGAAVAVILSQIAETNRQVAQLQDDIQRADQLYNQKMTATQTAMTAYIGKMKDVFNGFNDMFPLTSSDINTLHLINGKQVSTAQMMGSKNSGIATGMTSGATINIAKSIANSIGNNTKMPYNAMTLIGLSAGAITALGGLGISIGAVPKNPSVQNATSLSLLVAAGLDPAIEKAIKHEMIEKPYYDGAKVWRLSGALTATLIDNMLGTNGLTKKINQLLKDFNDKYQDSWWNENVGKYVPEVTANGMNEVAKFQQEYPEIFYGIMFLQSQLSKSSSMPSTIFDRLLKATVADNINSYMNSGELTGLSYANGYTSAMIAKAVGIPASLMNIGPTASAMGNLLERPATTLLNTYYNFEDEVFNTALYGTPQDMSHLMGKTQFEVDMIATEIAAMCFAPKATISMNIGNNAANFINSAAGQMQRIVTSTGAVQWVLVPGTVVTAGSTIAVGANVAGALAALDMASSASGGGKNKIKKFESTPELEEHLKYREEINPRTGQPHKNKKGVVGAHNSEEFFKNDVNILKEEKIYDIYGKEVKGLKKVTYQVRELDAARNPMNKYSINTNDKTIYDPKIISDKEFMTRGIEAANDALGSSTDGIMPREWIGVDSQGVQWKGYFNEGELESFFPTN